MVDAASEPTAPAALAPAALALAPALAPSDYHDPAVHQAEMRAIFRRSWLFVGMTDDLAEEDDFVTADLAGVSVAVRNVGGELRAFHNVCAHRFAILHPAPCGRGRFVCPYHGWAYDRDGVPVGVPGNAEHFGLDREARRRLALRRFEVSARGRFVFVRLEPGGPSLDEHLGAWGELLDHASAAFPDRFEDRVMPWAANWKIGVESVLEVYHVDQVHPETFKPFFRKAWDITAGGDHSQGVARLSDAGARYWDGIVKHLGLARSDRFRDYDNTLIFPNLAIGITHGAMMSVQTYEPLDAERCRLRCRLFLAPGRPDRRDGPVRRHVEESLRAINVKVLEEDRAVCETVQAGARQMDRPALPGANEARIHAFHRAVRAWRGDAA